MIVVIIIIVTLKRNAVISWVKRTLIEKFRTLNLSYVSMYSVEVLVRCAPMALNKVIRRYTTQRGTTTPYYKESFFKNVDKTRYLGVSEMLTISSFYLINFEEFLLKSLSRVGGMSIMGHIWTS